MKTLRPLYGFLPVLLLFAVFFVPGAGATNIVPSAPVTPTTIPQADPSADPAAVPSTDPVFPFNLLQGLIGDNNVDGATNTIELVLLLTILTLAPSILIMMTSFTRIVIVLSFTRNAMGTQQMPPNQAVIGLSLFLTFFTMFGTINTIIDDAWKPYVAEEIQLDQAFANAVNPLREFMFGQIRNQGHEDDLRSFISLAKLEQPETEADIPTHVLIPAFITSEIKTAFRIGFYIFLPFIVIDMVVASALMSMGMMMLPPAMISLPFKIMLFILVDGWNLVVQSVIQTFG